MTQDPAPHRRRRVRAHRRRPRARGPPTAGRGSRVPAAAGRFPADLRAPGPVHADEGDVPDALDGLDAALRAAVARYYAGDRTPDLTVRAAVHAVTDALRADGVDVVTALRTVKAQVAERGVPPGRLFDDAVRWCIARYYDRPAPPAPPPSTSVRRDADPRRR
jgi:hypothetical protein